MNVTVTLDWSLEEITIALNAIEAHKRRSESILPIRTLPETKVVIPEEKKKKKIGGRNSKAVEIHMGSKEGWFALYKIFSNMGAAASHLWLKWESNLQYYIKTGAVYKGIYKFFPHTWAIKTQQNT